MNSRKNLLSVFHLSIIASFLLSLNACGYKAPPYYMQEAPNSDSNVEFILKQEEDKLPKDNNTSAESNDKI